MRATAFGGLRRSSRQRNWRDPQESLAKAIGPGGELLAAPSRGCRRWVADAFRPVGRRRCKQRPSKQWVKRSPPAPSRPRHGSDDRRRSADTELGALRAQPNSIS